MTIGQHSNQSTEFKVFMVALRTEEFEAIVKKHEKNSTGWGSFRPTIQIGGEAYEMFSTLRQSYPCFKTYEDAVEAVKVWGVNAYAPVDGLVRAWIHNDSPIADTSINPSWMEAGGLIVTVYKSPPIVPTNPNKPFEGVIHWVNEASLPAIQCPQYPREPLPPPLLGEGVDLFAIQAGSLGVRSTPTGASID